MVLYQDIAKAVTMVIKEAFPNVPIYGDEVREGYKTPSFFIGIMPVVVLTTPKALKWNSYLLQSAISPILLRVSKTSR